MSIVDKLMGGLFGNKSDKDVKQISPFVEIIFKETSRIESFSNDQLREETGKMRQQIEDYIKEERDEISQLKEKIDEKDR